MLHPHTELVYINPTKNRGIVATQFIPKGTLIWVMSEEDKIYTSEEIVSEDIKNHDEFLMHAYRNNEGHYIYSADNARFVNHSSNSNCLLTPYKVEIAIRDIASGEELTIDYGAYNIIAPFQCDAEGKCYREMIFPDDLLRFHRQWDAELLLAYKLLYSVEQPLAYLLDIETKKQFTAIVQGKMKPLSILHCYYYNDRK